MRDSRRSAGATEENRRISTTPDELKAEIVRLGPWHLDLDVTPEVSTAAFLEAPPCTYEGSGHLDPGRITFFDPRPGFEAMFGPVYPDGHVRQQSQRSFNATELAAGST